MKGLRRLLDKLYRNNYLCKEEIVRLLKNLDDGHKEILLDYARETRVRYYGKKVYMRGLIEFSNEKRAGGDC